MGVEGWGGLGGRGSTTPRAGWGVVRDLSASHLGEIGGGMTSIQQEGCPLEKGKTEDKRGVLSNKNRLQKLGEKGS